MNAWSDFMNASFVLSLIVTALLMGCALEQEISRTPRTAVEQVLLTQAVEQALVNLKVHLPEGVNVDVDATGLESDRSRLHMTNADRGAIDRPSRDIFTSVISWPLSWGEEAIVSPPGIRNPPTWFA
jgi:hypothetical protein